MDYGIKVSRPGYSLDGNHNGQRPEPGTSGHILSQLAMPYLLGARQQVLRYREAATKLSTRYVDVVHICIHEASNLFEDLSALAQYTAKIGHTHPQHKLWIDIRNHIRHDTREEYDQETSRRRDDRAMSLGLDESLQTLLGFSETAIKVGSQTIQLSKIEVYIDWADKIITDVIDKAMAEGKIKASDEAAQAPASS